MVSKRLCKLACISALSGMSANAFAGGFQINEHNAAATGRASSVVATVSDPSAIWHNPAGLANAEGTQFLVGATMIVPEGQYVGVGIPSANSNGNSETWDARSTPVVVPNAYVSRALSSKAYVGFGFYLPYGLGLKWDCSDPIQAESTNEECNTKGQFPGRTVVQEISLRTFFMTPTIALKLADWVSVAVGVSLVPATVYLKRVLGASDNGQVLFPTSIYESEGTVEVSGSAFGVGANAGVQLTVIDHLKFGLAFRSAVDLSFSGDANFDIPADAPAEVRANFPDQGGSADITLPHTFLFGVGWQEKEWVIEASAQLTLWGSYDELRLNFDTGRPTPSSASPRNWNAVPLIRLGGEYRVGVGDYAVPLRLGVAYDVSPVPASTIDPTLPDSDRIIATGGLGFDMGIFYADLGYMLLWLLEREVTAEDNNFNFTEGKYAGVAVHLLSLSVGVRL
jgi:long-chain fatty acid transport protein